MAKLLYLVHRLPYPPNKGDKVRSYNLLKHLVQRHQIYLGAFIDDPADAAYLDTVRALCADMYVARLSPRLAKLRSLTGLFSGEALSLPYYRDRGLRDWIFATRARESMDGAVIFSSVMADYIPDMDQLPTLVDFVDMDSAKWTQYATTHRWPLSWIYQREGKRLLSFERAVALRARHSFFVTEAEVALFHQAAPECAGRVEAMCNGVDADFFSPDHALASPYPADETPIVFTGAMDYWPNVDAAVWFAEAVLPALRKRHPLLRFYVVGRSPDVAVQALAADPGAGVMVTGTVDDVRPYIAHAAVIVAPLRIARGIQNKVLEAMAMAQVVVASTACAEPIDAEPGAELLCAATAEEYIAHIEALLADPEMAQRMGAAARQRVVNRYGWHAHLSKIDRYIEDPTP
ncbi:sugar transferase [Rugosibacter aromaticivorans]|uniref:Sugar transferase n=1 Tax=Rugosibacter aromaticivorans TaxID=1565605 RepID=A0A0C5JA55_9PROT|nr:TIGR03087 family PEP-CTERM/XrtA system glycosyltransferase [Rugosibacter aromaticivorans]AJP48830.1 sugar transferase [Rugosibacter aromaticivorans]TAJ22553.1 MAG: TIGR03087 family PEP-CTERM/XrtA system glycosyltransferase [Rugosibacter sp.]TBR16001.1 MAG: TIGR03087 family PEP-CTERM/XrtA system glycosyltransferase [Rugosibacter sp.]